jgi:hypothetical protein
MIFLVYINHSLSLLSYSSGKDLPYPWVMPLSNKINQDSFLLMLTKQNKTKNKKKKQQQHKKNHKKHTGYKYSLVFISNIQYKNSLVFIFNIILIL